MRPDYIALHHADRAKHSGQSRAEYAYAGQRFEPKPYPGALWIALTLGLIAAISAALWS